VPYSYAGGPKVGTIATLAVALGNLAARKNCDWDPDKPGPPAEGGWIDKGTCYKYSDGKRVELVINNKNAGIYREIESIQFTRKSTVFGCGWVYRVIAIDTNGSTYNEERCSEEKEPAEIYTNPYPNSGDPSCLRGPGDNPGHGVEPLPPTHTYTTDEGCELNVDMKGLIQDNDGSLHGVWQIAPADETRAGGGVISGCNFYPTIYYDGGGSGGGGGTIPVPNPDPGDDWWKEKIATALAGAAGNLLANAVRQLFEAKLPPSNFTFVAPCDKKEDGTPAEVVYQWDEQNYQSRVLSQQAVLMEMLQQHLNWKTPICYGNDQAGTYWRAITFESTTYSDDSNSRLVKRFRYRSNTPGDVRLLAQHWAGFSWNTGPVIVRHTGSALGTPQVWASSVDEGKRVIFHAGREAGVDPYQTGKWAIGGTNSPRYGVQRTVVLKKVDGCWMATARQGPEGWPEAASVTPDL